MNKQMTGEYQCSQPHSLEINSTKGDATCCQMFSTRRVSCQLCDAAKENAELLVHLQKSNAEHERLQRQNESLKEELQLVRKKIETSEAEKNEQSARNTLRIQSLSRETTEMKRTLDSKDAELQRLEEVYLAEKKTRRDLETKISAAEEQIKLLASEHRKQYEALEGAFELLKSSHQTLNKAYQSAKEENIELEAKVETLFERISGLLQTGEVLSKLRPDEEKLEHENSFAEVLRTLEILVDRNSRTTDDLQRRNNDLQESLAKTQGQLNCSELKRKVLEEDMVCVRGQVTMLQRTALDAEDAYQKAEEVIQSLEEEKMRLRNELESLEERIEMENETRKETDVRVAALLKNVKKTEEILLKTKEHLTKQDQEFEEITSQKSFLESSVIDLEAEIRRLQGHLLKKNNKVESIQLDLQESLLENENLKKQLIDVGKINNHLQLKLRSSQSRVPEEDSLRKLWQDEIQSRSALGLRVARIEQEKQQFAKRLSKEKLRRAAQHRMKEMAETETRHERQKNVKLRKHINCLKSRLVLAQRRRSSVLDSIPVSNKDAVRDSEKSASSVVRSGLEAETERVRTLGNFNRHSERRANSVTCGDRSKNIEIWNENWSVRSNEMVPLDLNKRLNDMNAWIAEQSSSRQRMEQQRAADDSATRAEFRRVKQLLKLQLSQLTNKNLELETEKGAAALEAQTLGRMYDELKTKYVQQEATLEAVNNRLLKAQSQSRAEEIKSKFLHRMNIGEI